MKQAKDARHYLMNFNFFDNEKEKTLCCRDQMKCLEENNFIYLFDFLYLVRIEMLIVASTLSMK